MTKGRFFASIITFTVMRKDALSECAIFCTSKNDAFILANNYPLNLTAFFQTIKKCRFLTCHSSEPGQKSGPNNYTHFSK